MKLCKDCKFFLDSRMYSVPMCMHINAPCDPVFGGVDGSCRLMRSDHCMVPACGPDGKWFEPKNLDGKSAILEDTCAPDTTN